MIIRAMTREDVPVLTRLVNRAMEWDHFSEDLLVEKTVESWDLDGQFARVVESGGEVAGFAQGCLGLEKQGILNGHVRLLAVDRAKRRRGLGTALLREVESALKGAGAGAVTVMDCPRNYHMPGVDFRYTEAMGFLHKNRYEMVGHTHNMRVQLNPELWPALDAQVEACFREGVEIRRAVPEDREAIFAFLDKDWPSWKYEAGRSLDLDPPGIYIGVRGGEVVAFAAYQGNNAALPWFGPMGTSPDLRGRGVGAVLLLLCLQDLARQGWDYGIIPWVGPIGFYARFCGAKMDRCFYTFRKSL